MTSFHGPSRGTLAGLGAHSLAAGLTAKPARPDWLEKRKSSKLTETPTSFRWQRTTQG